MTVQKTKPRASVAPLFMELVPGDLQVPEVHQDSNAHGRLQKNREPFPAPWGNSAGQLRHRGNVTHQVYAPLVSPSSHLGEWRPLLGMDSLFQIGCPLVHQPPSPLKQVRPRIGRLGLVGHRMRKRRLDDLARMVGFHAQSLKLDLKPCGTAAIFRFCSIRGSRVIEKGGPS